MRIEQTEERDYTWEGTDPTFVVIFYEGSHDTSWDHDSWELAGCGLLDAIRWAQDKVSSGGAWAVGLVEVDPSSRPGPTRKGFTYLEGYDLNSGRTGLSDWEGRQLDEMVARSDGTVVLPSFSTTVFPNGSAATPEEPGGSVTHVRVD